MGITIHHRIGYKNDGKPNLIQVLDNAEKVAQEMKDSIDVPIKIRREKPIELLVDIGGCETLGLDFFDFSNLRKMDIDFLAEGGIGNIEEYYWCIGFCKTQFAEKLVEHKMVADLIWIVAKDSDIALVEDEGDYYHTGKIENAEEAIYENGKLIDQITGRLTGKGYKGVSKSTKIERKYKKKGNENR